MKYAMLILFGMAAASVWTACGDNRPDAPMVQLQLPISSNLYIDSEVAIDAVVDGCYSGVARLDFFQGADLVWSVGRDGVLALTRHIIPAEAFDLSGATYPAELDLSAVVTCQSGEFSESVPTQLRLIPAAGRLGPDNGDWPWPGYNFFVESDQTFLFCADDHLQRVNATGTVVQVSNAEIDCSDELTLSPVADGIIAITASRVVALTSTLERMWQRDGDQATLIGEQVVAVTQSAMDAPIVAKAWQVADGTLTWQLSLDAEGWDHLVAPPRVDDQGMVRVLTMGTTVSPLQGELCLWVIDPSDPQATQLEVVGIHPAVETDMGEMLSAPRGAFVPGSAVAVISDDQAVTIDGQTFAGHAYAIDLTSHTILWDEPSQGPVVFRQTDTALLASDDQHVALVGADGDVGAAFEIPDHQTLRQVLAFDEHGGVLLTHVDETGLISITFLDGDLEPVWTVPYPYAFGVGFDATGTLYFLSRQMVALLSPAEYRALAQ